LVSWLEREQRDVIEFLRDENRVLKGQLGARRVRLSGDEGRRLAGIGQLSPIRVADRPLNKWAVEQRTSLDIARIYGKMKAGTFPTRPHRPAARRIARV
jgi:hypothetical protein